MSKSPHSTSDEIFAAALAINDPAERAAYLDEVCTDDNVRADVEGLLEHYLQAKSFLEFPAIERPEMAWTAVFECSADTKEAPEAFEFLEPAQQPGSLGRLGQYEILEVIGRGGGCDR